MRESEKRRGQFRLQIRRHDISVKMGAMRQEMLEIYQASSFGEDMRKMLGFSRPAQEMVQYMLQQMEISTESFLPCLTELIVFFLGRNSGLFELRQTEAKGLIELLLRVWNLVAEELKPELAHINFIYALFDGLVADQRNNYQDGGSLFEMACALSLLHVARGNADSLLGEIQLHIPISSFKIHPISYQILLLVMINAPNQALSQRSRAELLSIARAIFCQIQSDGYCQNYQNLLLFQIGRHSCYIYIDRELLSYLASAINGKTFIVALNFLNIQVYKEEWVTYELISPLMKKCSLFISEVQDLKTFLGILSNVLVNDFSDPVSVQAVYVDFFQDRLHHYLKNGLMRELTKLLACFIFCKAIKCQRQLCRAILVCLERVGKSIKPKLRFRLLFYLLAKNQVNVAAIYSYCNNQREVQQFWQQYQQSGYRGQQKEQ